MSKSIRIWGASGRLLVLVLLPSLLTGCSSARGDEERAGAASEISEPSIALVAHGRTAPRESNRGSEPDSSPRQATSAPLPAELVERSHARMLDALQKIAADARDSHVYLQDRSLRIARSRLDVLGPTASPDAIWRTKWEIAMSEYRLGNEEQAIELIEELLATIGEARAGANPSNKHKVAFRLGEAYLRHAETLNCCQQYTPESCVFPIRGAGIHQRQEASRKAIEYFEQTLQAAPENSKVHLSARWLLNIAYMTVGEYPDQVPSEYLIPPDRLQPDADFPRFANISQDIGLATLSLAGGAVADDFDNDGDLDLLVSSFEPHGQIQYFRNNADGSFTNATEEAGLNGLLGGLNLVQADYDNDGDVDVLVLRGAWLGNAGRHPNSLLQNQGDGRFVDAAFAAGIAGEDYATQTAAWADYDHDGDLDLYVGNEHRDGSSAPSQLFRNNGDGTFTDVADKAGVTNDRFAKGVVWGDYDGDGAPDIFVSNLRQPNRLYRNNRDGTFTDVAAEAGVELPLASFPAWFWDFDNDGRLDLYVAAYAADISEIAAHYLGLPLDIEMARLYRNNGDGTFTDVGQEAHLARPSAPMGSNFGDLDNDGYLDIYLGTGYPNYRSLMPNLMYVSRGGKRFADVTFAGGFGSLQKGHGVVFADFDHDGDQDVFEQMGGAFAGDKFVDAFYENPGFGNQWICLELVGTRSNRSAIGARIEVTVRRGGAERTIYKYVNSGGSFGANPLRQTIGLGDASSITKLSVVWPTSQTAQNFADVQPDRFYRITEGSDQLEELDRKAFRFRAEQ